MNDVEWLISEYEKAPSEPPPEKISEYIEKVRFLPPGTPFPGPWKNNRTPYSVEIMDNMSPYSPIVHEAIMKAAQLGLTAACECVIAYWMDPSPTSILYISATEDLLLKWATKRLDPMISSCGFRHKVFAQTENKGSRRNGDRTFSKEFIGGALAMASARSAPSIRSDSIRLLVRDEIDGAPVLLQTGEGNWIKVSSARTNAWGNRKKILDFSTPTTWEESQILKLYEAGDQRKFLVPCPHCGKEQELTFGSEQTQHGVKADTKAGDLVQAFYMCEHCHDAIFNYHKTEMLIAGRWEPTTKSCSPDYVSRHISSLYSPVGMFSWTELWREYQEAQTVPNGMASFTNLYLGLPHKEDGYKPSFDKVLELRGSYKNGTVPHGTVVGKENIYIGPIYLTAGVDVQRGSQTDPNNPPRLELEVMATGIGYRTWSIDYRVFPGPIDDAFSGAWEDLDRWAQDGGLVYPRKDGKTFPVELVLIDSGDGMTMDVVYAFCKRWQNTLPSKGFTFLKRRKNEGLDEAGPMNVKRYRLVKVDDATSLVEISTNYYKHQLYNHLDVKRVPLEPQKAGFCDFPIDRGEKYFKGLTIEERRSDGSFHCPSGARNEPGDCRVYAMTASDMYLDMKVSDLRAAVKQNGGTQFDIEKVRHDMVIKILARNILTGKGK